MSDAPNPHIPGPDDPRRCHARKSNGEPCGKWAIRGATVCGTHGGRAPQVKAAAADRVRRADATHAAKTYGLSLAVEPLDALVTELHRTAGHVAWLGLLIGDLDHGVNDKGQLRSRLTQYNAETGERPSVWVEMYQKERAHLARVATDCLKAGVEERQVRIAEDQGRLVADVIRRIIVGLGIDPASDQAREVVRRELTVIDGGAAA